MKRRQQERHADNRWVLPQLSDQLLARGIVEHNGRRVQVRGDVVQSEALVGSTRTEDALGACDLTVQKLVADAGGVPMRRANRATDARQQNLPGATGRNPSRLRSGVPFAESFV